MAVNKPKGDNARKGAVKKRTQLATKTLGKKTWTKRDKTSGEFMDQKILLIASERPKQRVRLISGSSASTFPKLPCDSAGSCCPAVVPSCFYFPVSGLQHELSRYLAAISPLSRR
jgi:hypothetical protein